MGFFSFFKVCFHNIRSTPFQNRCSVGFKLFMNQREVVKCIVHCSGTVTCAAAGESSCYVHTETCRGLERLSNGCRQCWLLMAVLTLTSPHTPYVYLLPLPTIPPPPHPPKYCSIENTNIPGTHYQVLQMAPRLLQRINPTNNPPAT
jgi:hypothetical protein